MKDKEKALEFISREGFGTGTTFTTGLTAELMVKFAKENFLIESNKGYEALKKLSIIEQNGINEVLSRAMVVSEQNKKLHIAIGWRNKEDDPEFGKIVFANINQFMLLRKEYAKAYFKETDENKKEQLLQLVSNCNQSVKQVLGL